MGVRASKTVLKICWRSFSDYFGINKEDVKEFGGVEDPEKTNAFRVETGSLEPEKEAERSFISLELSCSLK